MSKTIKIIDLLNKIANGEEVPKKIRFHGLDFELDELERCYIHNDNDLDMTMDGLKYSQLNDIAEIIEEQEEIDIQAINLDFARLGQFSIKNAKGQEEILEVLFIEVQEKMKELARKINYLDKNIKEE